MHITKKNYEEFVSVKPFFFQRGIYFITHTKAIIQLEHQNEIQVELGAPNSVAFLHRISLFDEDTKSSQELDKEMCKYVCKDEKHEFIVKFQNSGIYKLDLFSRVKDPKESPYGTKKFDETLEYTIIVNLE
jgi:transglutaminase/protease-like cytokinesis protein 3